MRPNYPLISCICATCNRPTLLNRAINCFERQNYPNKELVISYPKKDKQTRMLVEKILAHTEINILLIERADEESVGEARNLAISKCKGDYICVWDDDDWYHPSRLSFQFNSMITTGIGYSASVLRSVILFDNTTQKAYLSSLYTWENTLMCKKEIIFQNQYAHRDKAEDTHIIQFLDKKKFLFHIDEAPFLYVYVYHGENTWEYTHYEHLISKATPLEDNLTADIQDLLTTY